MRKFLLAGVAVTAVMAAGVASSATAADLPVKAAPMQTPLPWNWTGFYIGGHFGAGWGTKEFALVDDPFEAKQVQVNGFLGGGQVGYNYQVGWVVLGVEGDIGAADIKGNDFPFAVKTDWLATITGRIGATIGPALLYVKGGVAWAHDKYTFCCEVTTTETRIGWVFGTGIEYAFTRNWSGKVEYNYLDFGTKDIVWCEGSECSDPYSVKQRIHTVKAGVNYRFDWIR
jgi:outer membrane immunogenic protein